MNGSDGKPLTGNYNLVIKVVQEYVTWDGKPGTRTWETQATIGKDGTVTFSTADLATSKNGGEYVSAMRYEVTSVTDNDPKNNSSVKWDGTPPTVRVVAPYPPSRPNGLSRRDRVHMRAFGPYADRAILPITRM